jgi:hypothetical protein
MNSRSLREDGNSRGEIEEQFTEIRISPMPSKGHGTGSFPKGEGYNPTL